MECSCTVLVDHAATPGGYKKTTREARRPHRCCECGGRIKRGDAYLYESGIWDGEPEGYKTCLDCESLRVAFFGGWTFTQIWGDFYNEFEGHDVPESCISKLTPKARGRVCDWIECRWEDEED
jgi:hypothetical protein